MSAKPDPSQSDDSARNTAPPFAGMGAGLGFFQDWMKAAGASMPGMVQAAAQNPATSAWSMPTLDPEELDKRIQELKTVQFWLEQNSRMIAMTIQGLEVQKMTLSTLQGMNVSMDKLRESLKAGTESTPPSAATQAPQAEAEPAPQAETTELVNPMAWWNSLTQQFTHLASQAAQSVQEAAQNASATQPKGSDAATTATTASASRKTAAKTSRPRAAKSANTTNSPAPKTAPRAARKNAPKS